MNFDMKSFNKQELRVSRAGFTLVELLIVLAIITILTSFLVVAIRGARRTALVQRSEAQMEKIRDILQNELEDLLDQPLNLEVPTNLPPGVRLTTHINFKNESSFSIADRFRVEARRKMILSRMPYHDSVIRNSMFLNVVYPAVDSNNNRHFRNEAFSVSQGLRDSYTFIANNSGKVDLPAVDSDMESVNAHNANSSELLYAVLKSIWVDDEPALSLFRDSEFGDTDDDGVLEILDAFGNPIFFRLQMTLPLGDPSALVNVNLPLDGISAWMTDVNITRVNGANVVLPLADANTDILHPDRVRVVVTSQEVEPFPWSLVVPVNK